MFNGNKVTEIYCLVDDFYELFESQTKKYALETPKDGKRNYHRDSRMSPAEIMTIVIMFHGSGYRCIKHFYNYIRIHRQDIFPQTVSYNRFVEL